MARVLQVANRLDVPFYLGSDEPLLGQPIDAAFVSTSNLFSSLFTASQSSCNRTHTLSFNLSNCIPADLKQRKYSMFLRPPDILSWHMQFHGQDGLGDVPDTDPALASISHEPLQGIAALKLIEVRIRMRARCALHTHTSLK